MTTRVDATSIRRGVLAGVAFVALTATWPVQAATEAKGGKLVVGIDETASEYWSEYLQGVRDIADSLGKSPVVLTSNYQGDQLLAQLGATYAAGCHDCALATDPSSNAFVKAIVGRSAKAKVHVVTLWNRPEDIHPWDTFSDYWVAHTSFDGVMSGYEQAMALCKALGGKGTIAAIEGVPSTPPAYQRIRGLKKALAECPGLKLVDTQVGDWQETKAQDITRTWLAHYGSTLQGIFASNDSMARGTVAALKEKGLNGKILVTGSDGSNIGLEMVKSGDMLVTIWNDPVLQGAISMSLAYAAAIGDVDPQKLTHAQRDFYLKEEPVTRDNVDKYLAMKHDQPKYSYEDIKKDFWKDSAGQIPQGANDND